MADSHNYTLITKNADGETLTEVTVSCSCPQGQDHSQTIQPGK